MIQTYSSFFYIDPVTATNFYLNFNEGGGPLTAEVESGAYTLTDLAAAIESALNDAGALTYTVTLDRDTRKFTIEASANFSLLITSGVNVGTDIFSLIGFTGADLSGDDTYTGNLQAGSEYIPQFRLQDFVEAERNQKAVQAAVNESAAGDLEVVKFGVKKYYEFSIQYITNAVMPTGAPINNNQNAVSEVTAFMEFCCERKELEFMPDIDDKDVFYKIILEKTESDSNGTGFKLNEWYTKGLPDYYDTGVLTFRKVGA